MPFFLRFRRLDYYKKKSHVVCTLSTIFGSVFRQLSKRSLRLLVHSGLISHSVRIKPKTMVSTPRIIDGSVKTYLDGLFECFICNKKGAMSIPLTPGFCFIERRLDRPFPSPKVHPDRLRVRTHLSVTCLATGGLTVQIVDKRQIFQIFRQTETLE